MKLCGLAAIDSAFLLKVIGGCYLRSAFFDAATGPQSPRKSSLVVHKEKSLSSSFFSFFSAYCAAARKLVRFSEDVNTASFRATAITAFLLAAFPPLAAMFRPYLRRSQSGPVAENVLCGRRSLRTSLFPALLIGSCLSLCGLVTARNQTSKRLHHAGSPGCPALPASTKLKKVIGPTPAICWISSVCG